MSLRFLPIRAIFGIGNVFETFWRKVFIKATLFLFLSVFFLYDDCGDGFADETGKDTLAPQVSQRRAAIPVLTALRIMKPCSGRIRVIINNRDGKSYKLRTIKEHGRLGKSPLEDIPCIKLNITTREIVAILHEGRADI
jgi:hypothetical protein